MLTNEEIFTKTVERTLYNTIRPIADGIMNNIPPIFRSAIDEEYYLQYATDIAMDYVKPYVNKLSNFKLEKTGSENFTTDEAKFMAKEITSDKIDSIFQKMEMEMRDVQ